MKKHLITILLFYVLVPITGSGTRESPYLPDWPGLVGVKTYAQILALVPTFRWSCYVKNDPVTGAPLTSNMYCWVPDDIIPPGKVVAVSKFLARQEIKLRGANDREISHMEALK